MNKVDKARISLKRQGFEVFSGDVGTIKSPKTERADILMPDGSREIWVRTREMLQENREMNRGK